jgi:hypothetical protein
VSAEIGAAQHVTPGVASHLLLVAVGLRDRLPNVGALFTAGLVSYRQVATVVYRSALIRDPDALRAVDTALADALQQWAPMSADKTTEAIDALILQYDAYALRRTQDRARGRSVEIYYDDASGTATLWATLFAVDAEALDARLNALGETVCPNDPRTRDQRRSDALGTFGHVQDRLSCLCGQPDCPAATLTPSSVVIHVVAPHDAITPTPSPQPGPDSGGSPADGSPDGDGPGVCERPDHRREPDQDKHQVGSTSGPRPGDGHHEQQEKGREHRR